MTIEELEEIRMDIVRRKIDVYGDVYNGTYCRACNYTQCTIGLIYIHCTWDSGDRKERGIPIIYNCIIALPCLVCSNLSLSVQLRKFEFQWNEWQKEVRIKHAEWLQKNQRLSKRKYDNDDEKGEINKTVIPF